MWLKIIDKNLKEFIDDYFNNFFYDKKNENKFSEYFADQKLTIDNLFINLIIAMYQINEINTNRFSTVSFFQKNENNVFYLKILKAFVYKLYGYDKKSINEIKKFNEIYTVSDLNEFQYFLDLKETKKSIKNIFSFLSSGFSFLKKIKIYEEKNKYFGINESFFRLFVTLNFEKIYYFCFYLLYVYYRKVYEINGFDWLDPNFKKKIAANYTKHQKRVFNKSWNLLDLVRESKNTLELFNNVNFSKLIYCKHNNKESLNKKDIFVFSFDSFLKHFEKIFNNCKLNNQKKYDLNDKNDLNNFFNNLRFEDIPELFYSNDKKEKKYIQETFETVLNYIKSRLPANQKIFREKLLKIYKKCLITDIDIAESLVASHIVSWAYAHEKGWLEEDTYSINNGFIFHVGFDSLFDKHLVSFDEKGKLYFSPLLLNYFDGKINVLIENLISKIGVNKFLLEIDDEGFFKNSFFDILKNSIYEIQSSNHIIDEIPDIDKIKENLHYHYEITKNRK